MSKLETSIRIDPEHKHLLAEYKLHHRLRTYSESIAHAIQRAEEAEP